MRFPAASTRPRTAPSIAATRGLPLEICTSPTASTMASSTEADAVAVTAADRKPLRIFASMRSPAARGPRESTCTSRSLSWIPCDCSETASSPCTVATRPARGTATRACPATGCASSGSSGSKPTCPSDPSTHTNRSPSASAVTSTGRSTAVSGCASTRRRRTVPGTRDVTAAGDQVTSGRCCETPNATPVRSSAADATSAPSSSVVTRARSSPTTPGPAARAPKTRIRAARSSPVAGRGAGPSGRSGEVMGASLAARRARPCAPGPWAPARRAPAPVSADAPAAPCRGCGASRAGRARCAAGSRPPGPPSRRRACVRRRRAGRSPPGRRRAAG